ncbi:phage late control D family protein [Sorangium sp. So ce117]|uniref:phage late control D family protein n=1 Tax=Sorangium sp. So ce117 TaxID=3133277 RepID=UPI003F645ECA
MANGNDVTSDLRVGNGGATDLYVPEYRLKFNGTPVPEVESDFLSVTVSDSVNELSTFELVLNNWLNPGEPGGPGFKYTERLFDHIRPGTLVEVEMGYADAPPLVPMITGEITAIDPRYRASGGSTVALRGFDLLHRLRNCPRSFAWKNVTDAAIARRIIGGRLAGATVEADAQLGPGGPSLPKHHHVPQQNLDDLAFLRERAKRVNFDVYMRDRKLCFARSHKRQEPAITLEWGLTLNSFMPSLTFAQQVSKVTVRAWHPSEGRLIEKSATSLAPDEIASGQKAAVQRLKDYFREEKEEIVTSEGVLNDGDAEALARAILERSSHGFVTGPAETTGVPHLRAGTIVRFEKLDKVFNGDYYVTESTHRIDGHGYRTKFNVSKVCA